MYELCTQTHISSAHFLRDYKGECANLHGHNWVIKVFVQCTELNQLGMCVDFKLVKQNIKELVTDLDHCNLNEISYFKTNNPTCENFARYLYKKFSEKMNDSRIKISKIEVTETPGNSVAYWE